MRKQNALVLGAAVALCALLLLAGLWLGRGGAPSLDGDEPLYLLVTVDGQTREPIPLEAEGDYAIEQEDLAALNVVHMTPDSVWMASSTCKNQDCVRQGAVTRENRGLRLLGDQIICLPNKVVLRLCTRQELDGILTLE